MALFLILLVASLLVMIIAAISMVSDPTILFSRETGQSGEAAMTILWFLSMLQGLVLVSWAVSLFVPLREPIAEYQILIENRAAAQPAAYWWVRNTALRRRSPFEIRSAKAQGIPILVLGNGRERGLITVTPTGEDLFVGWTIWRDRSTVVLIAHLIRDLFQGSSFTGDVRGVSSRAFRELIHSITREGVQAAILRPPVSDSQAWATLTSLPESRNFDLMPSAPSAQIGFPSAPIIYGPHSRVSPNFPPPPDDARPVQ